MEAHVIMSPTEAAVIKRADNSRNSAKGFCVCCTDLLRQMLCTTRTSAQEKRVFETGQQLLGEWGLGGHANGVCYLEGVHFKVRHVQVPRGRHCVWVVGGMVPRWLGGVLFWWVGWWFFLLRFFLRFLLFDFHFGIA